MMKSLTRITLATFVSTLVLSQAAYASCGAGSGSCVTLSSMVTTTATSGMLMTTPVSVPAPTTVMGPAAPVTELSGSNMTDNEAAK